MNLIEKIAKEAIDKHIKIPISEVNTKDQTMYVSNAILATVDALCVLEKQYEDKLRWISIDEKDPECTIEEEGIYWSEYLEIKVKGYKHPFIGYYVKANDDQFFDFIHKTIDEGIKQADITHYRFIP